MFARLAILLALVFASVAEAAVTCDCSASERCLFNDGSRCVGYQTGTTCTPGTHDVCGGGAPPEDPCPCGSAKPCIHQAQGDNTCFALNAGGNCPTGTASTCLCVNDKINGRKDTGCVSNRARICVLNGVEPAPGQGGNECVRCVSTPKEPNGGADKGCRNKPFCVSQGDNFPEDNAGKAGDECVSEGFFD